MMVDNVLLSASRTNVHETVALAVERGKGVEVMAFAFPDILDGDWRITLAEYQEILKPLEGTLTLHGPFMDMVSGSPDPRINAVCVQRYSHAIRIAAELGAKQVVFHANFIGSLHNTFYREGWHQRNIIFWKPMAEYAAEHGVTVLLENMWEFDPTILSDLLSAVDNPALRCCFDVGHAHLFSDKQYTFDYWLRTLEPWLSEIHMNNNNGIIDEHHGFDWSRGVLDYQEILPKIRAAHNNLDLVLEMDLVEDMRDSLYYFRIEELA
ncbi:MAG: sugar phosphate isomerase/epimerase family protein [Anaerolineae bacterium]|nr:sugar phosphate isomerase/epimerase family protein [Anaerolineae bacterium]